MMAKFGYNILKDRKIYGNCQVISPDDFLMFRCDLKKANWYLNRNLAEVIQESPLKIKLNFNPRGLGNHDKPFGLSTMDNKCVNCGTESFLTRHHVVPICYRKHFPLNMKSHNFHDVLSMCMDCHESYERKADNLKKELGEQYNAPLNGVYSHNKILLKAIKNCNTILRGTDGIPDDRVEEIKSQIREFLGRDFMKSDLIEISGVKKNILEKTHGQIVMEQIGDIQSFIELWRNHFVEHNECKYLPSNWDVNNVIIINE
jgi:hypothetical protein